MKVGFTGTQAGMSAAQLSRLKERLVALRPTEFHHGDCIGADAEACFIAIDLGIKTIAHPPENSRKRAFTPSEIILPVKPYMERNHDIVDSVDLLLVAPKTNQEVLRSGTWATWRYAFARDLPNEILER